MNFIKLTRFDNRPVWLNAGFIVTVEPRRDGVGSVVVPIGDGLDYDVRESTDEVLKMLAATETPSVVPVPVPDDGLAPTPEDVSPEPESESDRAATPASESAPRAASPAEPKKPRRRAAKSARTEDAKAVPAERKAASRKTAKKSAALELSDGEIARLARLSPKTVEKLQNTLLTQFHVADVLATIQGLEAKQVFALDGRRVVWPSEAPANPHV